MPGKIFTYGKFTGLNNVADPTELGPEELVAAENVDISDRGRLKRRPGFTQVHSGTVHSLWSNRVEDIALFVEGTDLKRLSVDDAGNYTVSELRSGVAAVAMSYADAAGDVYYSNGYDTGMIRDGVSRPWGVKTPAAQPTLSAAAGALPPGRYQVAITYVDDLGRESGARMGAFIELTTNRAIQCSGIPSSGEATITTVRVYCTPVDGDMFYRVAEVPDGTSSVRIGVGYWTIPLATQFLSEPPVGTIVRYVAGRVAVVSGNAVYLSEALSYHLFNLRKWFFQFPAPITMAAPVRDGLYISADRLYWLPVGSEDAPLGWLADYKAIPGTDVQIGGDDVGDGTVESHVLFMTEKGPCYGGPGGAFKNLTNTRVAYPEAVSGASVVRDQRGMSQFITSVRRTDSDGNVYTSDRAEATVIRNGVVIP